MIRLRRFTLLLTLAALLAMTMAAAPAEAAKRKVPFGFFGTVVAAGAAVLSGCPTRCSTSSAR